ncbi:universal stress protein [Paucisalibacillus globulus]|uniref:universal stress protein n=1 Tax=Paucisalibacillus globulus TaxID=351095 RepID=UPI0015967B94|nr:universal stress protein [Paucisalibacillus globulus]
MEGFNHILVAFDGSDSSVLALKKAEYLSKLSDAKLTVTYVHDSSTETSLKPGATPNDNPRLFYSSTYVGVVPTPGEGVYRETENTQQLDHITERIVADARSKLSTIIKADYEVLVGKPADKLIEFANKEDIDLIIMGNRGISGLKKIVTGSVSKKVLDEANCPVLVVK